MLPGKSVIQDSYQEVQESKIPGRNFKILQEVERWDNNKHNNNIFNITNNYFIDKNINSSNKTSKNNIFQ